MSARLDVSFLQRCKRLVHRQREETVAALNRYHSLAYIRRLLKTPSDKRALVDSSPEISAQIFYHFYDNEIGGLIVQRYARHELGERRELALHVEGVLDARQSAFDSPEVVLGMRTIPTFPNADHEEYPDGYIDNAHKVAEELAF